MNHWLATYDLELPGYLESIESDFAAGVAEMSEHFPVLVGGWCLSVPTPEFFGLPAGKRAARSRSRSCRRMSKAWELAIGWTYSSYKHSDEPPKVKV